MGKAHQEIVCLFYENMHWRSREAPEIKMEIFGFPLKITADRLASFLDMAWPENPMAFLVFPNTLETKEDLAL